jgi:glucose-6-phosphate 1-dehydrogenase
MRFDYDAIFGEPPESYEGLLLDCIHGDQTLFVRTDWVELAWGFITPLLEAWAADPPGDLPNYAAGSWGPPAAGWLLDNRRWRNDCSPSMGSIWLSVVRRQLPVLTTDSGQRPTDD